MAPVLNFALTCRGCEDAKCVKACPERALSQSERQVYSCSMKLNVKAATGVYKHVTMGESQSIRNRKSNRMQLCEGEPQCRRILS